MDFGPNRAEMPENILPSLQGSVWEYSCGNPDVFEKVIFNEDSTCTYITRNIYGQVSTSNGVYRIEGNNLGIRFFKGIRNKQINYTVNTIPGTNSYYFAEQWSDQDIRYFILKRYQQLQDVPEFEGSDWKHYCGNPEYYEKIEFLNDNTVSYTSQLPGQELKMSKGVYQLSQDRKSANVVYSSENRNFEITYQIYQRSSDGEYYILEKWNDQDLRYFVIERK